MEWNGMKLVYGAFHLEVIQHTSQESQHSQETYMKIKHNQQRIIWRGCGGRVRCSQQQQSQQACFKRVRVELLIVRIAEVEPSLICFSFQSHTMFLCPCRHTASGVRTMLNLFRGLVCIYILNEWMNVMKFNVTFLLISWLQDNYFQVTSSGKNRISRTKEACFGLPLARPCMLRGKNHNI